MNPALIGVAGLGLLLMLSGKAKALPGPDEVVPQAVIDRMARALATNDPSQLRAEAAKLRADGYGAQALDLERAAAELEAKRPAPAPAPAPAPSGARVLKLGVNGTDVRAWQQTLAADGFVSIAIDSSFGAETERLTKDFQTDRAVGVDGQVGPETLAAVGKAVVIGKRLLQFGSEGGAVKAWQAVIGKPPIGKFDAGTETATKAWQAARGLTADGKVGPATAAWIGKPLPAPAPVVVPAPAPAPAAPVVPAPVVPAPAPVVVVPAPVVVVPAPAPSGARLLKLGLSGTDVRAWQQTLAADGFVSIAIDSSFGTETERLTKDFQTDRAVGVDGQVGPETLAAVGKAVVIGKRLLQLGSEGGAVKAWQAVVARPPIGKFDAGTETATKTWQAARGLTADGKVGPATAAWIGKPIAAAPALPAPLVYVNPATWPALLAVGMSGQAVKEWQTILVRDGSPLKIVIDGFFGAGTETATKAWQAARGLAADGKVGPGTVAKIVNAAATVVAGDLALVAAHADGPRLLELPPTAERRAPLGNPALALRLLEHLRGVQRGREDRTLVQRFQAECGLKATGAYGPGTAELLVQHGLIPPWPFYWPSKGTTRARAKYRAALLEQARREPPRALEWTAAAQGGPS